MLMRTDPFRELDRMAQQVFGTPARPAAMAIDAYRKGDDFVVLFDLPGIDPSSIDLTIERNVLSVHAERQRPADDDVELLIGERPTGSFSRQLFLAETLDTDRLQAEYTDGVLRVRMPVKEQAKPRRVDINATSSGPRSIDATTTDATTSDAPTGDGRQPAAAAT
jgi:HSP20 family protein